MKVLLAGDNAEFKELVNKILASEQDIEVVGEAKDGAVYNIF